MQFERVAIVHDWLTSMRGGERVVEALYGVFPRADLFTLTWDPGRLSPALTRRGATTSAIHRVARAPFMNGRFRALLPLFPLAVESFELGGYDLVVSSSHCVAIGAVAPPAALHVAYVHSTLRYVREGQPVYEASVPGGRVGRALFRGAARYLRGWEAAAAARPHELIANSGYTRERIRRYYRRDAQVIEPPIDTDRFERAGALAAPPDDRAPYLVVSALVPNKRVDLALRAFQGRPERLVVVGEGPERRRLEPLAGPNVTLLPRVGEDELAALCAGSRALLHTGIDDFGMVMVEALAAGTPVIACAEGGALDIVRDGETGLLIDSPTVESVRGALDRFARQPRRFDPAALRAFAKRFDRAEFERRFSEAVEEGRRRRRDAGAQTANGSLRSSSADRAAAANGESGRRPAEHAGANGSRSHPPPVLAREACAFVVVPRASNGAPDGPGGGPAAPTLAAPQASEAPRNGQGARNGLAAHGEHSILDGQDTHDGHSARNGQGAHNGLAAHNGHSTLDGLTAHNGHSTDPRFVLATNAEHDAPGEQGVHDGHSTLDGLAVHNGHSTPYEQGAQSGQTARNGRGIEDRQSPQNGHRFASGHAAAAVFRPALCPPLDPEPRPPAVDPEFVRHRLARHSKAALRAKRIADVTIAACGLVATAPLVATLGALIPLTSPGPAFFRQRRTGLDQRPFVLVKLRTMDAEGRITIMGRLLRPLGLDELPQLWNVLKGDMSVVGPRPELPDLVARYERDFPGYGTRHLVRPGITGWAQVNGLRGNVNLSIPARLRFDLQYLCEWEPSLDARILARTLSTVIKDTIESFREGEAAGAASRIARSREESGAEPTNGSRAAPGHPPRDHAAPRAPRAEPAE